MLLPIRLKEDFLTNERPSADHANWYPFDSLVEDLVLIKRVLGLDNQAFFHLANAMIKNVKVRFLLNRPLHCNNITF